MFKKNIIEKKITNLELFYDGAHNKTYKGNFLGEAVQVRISKNKIVDHKNEIKLLNNQNNIIFIDDKMMIKKWIDGHELNRNDLEILTKISVCLIKHWNLKIEGITSFKFDNNDYYNKDEIVLSHGDLRKKNIIVDNEQNVHIIDFEWINYTSLYFDLGHLHLYCSFTIDDIVKVFKVDYEKLKKAILSIENFNLKWEKETYK
ncbi:MAG: phosphotransferase [Metamycoplasmataceae bacterium]